MSDDKPKGATTVEEWLAQGNRIKTERALVDVEPIVVRFDGNEFEFVADESGIATFICRVSGVYGYRRRGTGFGAAPHICRRLRCDAPAVHYRNSYFWCTKHRDHEGTQ